MATKVSVGVTSATGYAATLVGLIGTVLALVLPDVPQEQSAMIASAVFAVGSFVVTQVGRYVQAREQIKAAAAVAKPASWQGSVSAPDLGGSPVPAAAGATYSPDEPPAPYTPDGELAEHMKSLPTSSLVADPRDRKGADDHPATA